MSNLKNLKTNHYKTKIVPTKKLKLNNTTYIGFKINDLFKLKEFIKEDNIIDFTYKGLSFINNIEINSISDDFKNCSVLVEDLDKKSFFNSENIIHSDYICSIVK